ncbi:MAG: NAD(P)H-dependent oxidoreductase [Marinicella sp.]|nr:NAD(P)H-dependent oxidoreductase [Xanthomonadales bacterium]
MTQTILKINSSGRTQDSLTRNGVNQVVDWFKRQDFQTQVIERDLNHSLPFIDEVWIDANFTSSENRTSNQQHALNKSNELINELFQSDLIVIGLPIYNFSIPATLKAWIDQVSRAKVTFQYTEKGPEGLIKNKQAILVYASGGTPLGSEIDFATPYLKYILGFIGIDDVTIIDTNQENKNNWSLDQQLSAIKQKEKKYA